ncbi:MAG: 3-dehydroquinate synthase [Gemmatimonadales bacterium]
MEPVVRVVYSAGSYPVFVAPGLIGSLAARCAALLPGRRLVVVTDRTVARAVSHDLSVPTLVVAPGEASKTRARWGALTDRLLALGLGRDGALVAVGGGVVGDLAGFVAATYLRGIPWIAVPTSLLAMVDASVGGKTGVNTRLGKNLVGAFHPPAGVLADPAVLRTLHLAHLRAGLVEALKHGLVADAEYFDWTEREAESLLGANADRLTELVGRSVTIKASIVTEDEREQGRRAVLNAGHTIGHAIEQVSRFSILHGEAVGIGLAIESLLAERIGVAASGLAARVGTALDRLGSATALQGSWTTDALLAALGHDKKVRDTTLRFALPASIGTMSGGDRNWTVPVSEAVVRDVLECSRPG